MEGKRINLILCPYDFSSYSEKALEYAIDLSKICCKRLTILHVLVNPFLFEGSRSVLMNNVLAEDLLAKMREEEELNLSKLKEKTQKSNPEINIEFIIEESNDIGESIINVQTRIGADLIVMGSHGRKGIKRAVVGSVAEDVLRSAKCPVLIVK